MLSVWWTAFYNLIVIVLVTGYNRENTKDQTSPRANTLFDDADDIQKQLNNEAHDKILFGGPKTVWVLHLPTESPHGYTRPWSRYTRDYKYSQLYKMFQRTKTDEKFFRNNNNISQGKQWSYKDQCNWYKHFPACGGRSQSPVDLPAVGLIKSTKGCRKLSFLNYDIAPNSLTLKNDGKQVILQGEWECNHQPVVYGGTTHGRRYLFHSITLRWPSEHRIGGLQYPLESQVLHLSAEYKTLQEVIDATPRDAQAILGIVNFYKYSNETQEGLVELLRVATNSGNQAACVPPRPLQFFNPPLKEHVGYQGSLTTPPCSENVLWLIRARALPVTREIMDVVYNYAGSGEPRGSFIRQPQPLNGRKVFFFN